MTGSSYRFDWVKILVIGVMCMAQSFPFMMINSTVPTVFRDAGLDLKDFWAFSLLTIPAWAKFLWAPFVDAHGFTRFGMRKTWIAGCTGLGAVSLLLLVGIEPGSDTLQIIVAVLFVHMLIMATQDIAVDAYTLENLSEDERGVGSSVKVVLETIGDALALAGLLYVYSHIALPGASSGWSAMLIVATVLLVLFTLPVLIRREPPMPAAVRARREAGERPSLMRFLRRADSRVICGLLFVAGAINFMLPPLLGPLLVDSGFALVQVGVVLGVVTPFAAPSGAALCGLLITVLGFQRTLAIQLWIAFLAGAVALFAFTSDFKAPQPLLLLGVPAGPASVPVAILAFFPLVFSVAMMHMTVIVARMRWASRNQAGTDFTAHGAVYNIGRTSAVAVSPLIAAYLGWPWFLASVAGLLAILALSWHMAHEALERQVLRRITVEERLENQPSEFNRSN